MTATTLLFVVVIFGGVGVATGSPSLGVLGAYVATGYLAMQTGDQFLLSAFVLATVVVSLAAASFGAKLITGNPSGGG